MTGSTDALCAELSEFCRFWSFSEDGLKEIIERHGCTPNHPPIDNYDFFYLACENKKVTEGILQYLLEYFPDAASAIAEGDLTPLHVICRNKNATLDMVQLLIGASPDSLHHRDRARMTPLYCFCFSRNFGDEVGLEILKLLLEKCPESVRDVARSGYLPIHAAVSCQSANFCRMLIDAYPRSARMTSDEGVLPLHLACLDAHSITTVELLYEKYPESIYVADTFGLYPIHLAINGIITRRIGNQNARFLLDCDPNVASQGELPLYYACHRVSSRTPVQMRRAVSAASNDTLRFIKLVFDVYPQAIEDPLMTNLGRLPGDIQLFIDSRLSTARLARNHHLMTTVDGDGRLPLHVAIGDNDCLGSIKLLVNGNPAAAQAPDNSGALPLHIACQYHKSVSIAEYLIGLDPNTLAAVDEEGNTALHYACRGANYDIITLLLEKYVAPFVSKRNVHDKLPIDFLLESDSVYDRDGIDYLQSVFQLIRSCPETINHMIPTNRI
jgi:ankyrin repeat protein